MPVLLVSDKGMEGRPSLSPGLAGAGGGGHLQKSKSLFPEEPGH